MKRNRWVQNVRMGTGPQNKGGLGGASSGSIQGVPTQAQMKTMLMKAPAIANKKDQPSGATTHYTDPTTGEAYSLIRGADGNLYRSDRSMPGLPRVGVDYQPNIDPNAPFRPKDPGAASIYDNMPPDQRVAYGKNWQETTGSTVGNIAPSKTDVLPEGYFRNPVKSSGSLSQIPGALNDGEFLPILKDADWYMTRDLKGLPKDTSRTWRDPISGYGISVDPNRNVSAAAFTYYDPQGRKLRSSIFDPAELYKNAQEFGINLSGVGSLGQKLDAAGVSYKPGQLYAGTGSNHGIDFKDIAKGGVGTSYDWTSPAYRSFSNPDFDQANRIAAEQQQAKIDLAKSLQLTPFGKASGGSIQGVKMDATLAQMRAALVRRGNPVEMQSIGVNEAMDINPKAYIPPDKPQSPMPAPGGVATESGMPIGGVDTSRMAPGQQLLPNQQVAPGQPQQGNMPGAQPSPLPTGFQQPPSAGPAAGPSAPPAPPSNILSMTPQGRALSAMSPVMPQRMATGGSAKAKAAAKIEQEKPKETRMVFNAEGPGGVKGINVPRHMWEGSQGVLQKGPRAGQTFKLAGMKDVNAARARVYGAENRDPLTIGQIGKVHKETLEDHFSKPVAEQKKAESEALERLRDAQHIGKTANTLDESEKLDTVRHEYDEEGRSHVGYASKGVAGHALYTSGHGANQKHHVLNTCPGQTEGCGGGKDAKGVVDTTKGTCFAPVAEAQYPGAAVRRASHEQAKHDPAMTRDWILAHTGSMREAAEGADKKNQRLLFRPNVVDETDVSSRHVIRHLNEQRKKDGKPPIIANSYGKTNELHDPANGYFVTHSNVGPKVKHGKEIPENIGRDKQRVQNTIHAANARGQDFENEQGEKTPPKGSYMVTNVKRGSPLSKKMEEHITHAKYWSTGREANQLSEAEKAEGPEGHYNGEGEKTSEDKSHYGHTTVNGRRYDYQRQHILHPRLVNVPARKKNKATGAMEDVEHMIPTDSRFKDTEFLPKDRYKTKNGKEAGHILMTTPTESTSNVGHETSFTHHVGEENIKHAQSKNGEYEIDKPEDQEKARGKTYVAPQEIKFTKKGSYADGGSVYSRHPGLSDDDFHAFPESNYAAQRHLAMRMDPSERDESHIPKGPSAVMVAKNIDGMRHEMMTRRKG